MMGGLRVSLAGTGWEVRGETLVRMFGGVAGAVVGCRRDGTVGYAIKWAHSRLWGGEVTRGGPCGSLEAAMAAVEDWLFPFYSSARDGPNPEEHWLLSDRNDWLLSDRWNELCRCELLERLGTRRRAEA